MSGYVLFHHDNGWFQRDLCMLEPTSSPSDLLEAYLRHECFWPRIGGIGGCPEMHGPFLSELIGVEDFRLLDAAELSATVAAARHPPDYYGPSDGPAWARIVRTMEELAASHDWTLALNLTEEDSERFHEWGGCFGVFREFLFANAGSPVVERCILGDD